MRKVCLALYLVIGIVAFAPSEIPEMTGGILHGGNWSCMIEAPKGWVLDNQSWVKYEIYALFYQKGKIINENKNDFPIIYFNSGQLRKEDDVDLKKYVDYDLENYKKNQNYKIVERKIKLKNYRTSYCYDFDNVKTGQLETTVYVRFKDGAHLVVLTTHDNKIREELIPTLLACVDKMRFGDIIISK